MIVLLTIVVETLILLAFLWIGKSIMKAQVQFKALLVTSLAGAFASQVPFVGTYLSYGVVLFFLWKMARVDMVPDGALILIIGKGMGFIAMIYVVGILQEYAGYDDYAMFDDAPVYVDEEGVEYFAEEEQVYYLDEEGEKVYVDPMVIFGLSDVMEFADEVHGIGEEQEFVEAEENLLEETVVAVVAEEVAVKPTSDFSVPSVSDSVVRGINIPYQIFVPQGWEVMREDTSVALRLEGHTYIHCYASDLLSDNKSYLRGEVDRVLSQYSGYEIARQELVTVDGKQWARIHFADQAGSQVLLLTHGGNFGCYTVELNGSYQQLKANKQILNRMVTSFKFPPSTFLFAKVESEE